MNKKTLILFLALIVIGTNIFAQKRDDRIVVNRSDLPPALAEQLAGKGAAQTKMKQYGEWVGLGKELGNAVNGGLVALTDNADKFAKTDVGKFTLVLIAFKILGWPLIHFVVGTLIFWVGLFGVSLSWWLTCRPRKILASVKEDKTKTYHLINDHISDDRLGWHWFLVGVVLVVSLCTTFSG